MLKLLRGDLDGGTHSYAALVVSGAGAAFGIEAGYGEAHVEALGLTMRSELTRERLLAGLKKGTR